MHCQGLSVTQCQQQWDHFRQCDVSLCCNKTDGGCVAFTGNLTHQPHQTSGSALGSPTLSNSGSREIVLVRTDHCTTFAYINRQNAVQSENVRVLNILSLENRIADPMLRGNSLAVEFVLHPEVGQQIWNQFWRVEVDLFANQNNNQCLLWFSLMMQENPPLGVLHAS